MFHLLPLRIFPLCASSIIMASTIELPNEIWFGVFSYLDYSGLKNCMRVNKAFKSYTELPVCQKTMFRSKAVVPRGGAINLDDVQTHPAFESMVYQCDPRLSRVTFLTADFNEVMLANTCAANEHATNPPVAFMRIQITGWTPLQLKNKTGVTVVQVMRSLCKFFSTGRHRESRGDHTRWTGWDETKLDISGDLWLRVVKFDSSSVP